MAREKMVTRTIEVTTATLLALDITTSQVYEDCISRTGNYNEEEMLKFAKKNLDTSTHKMVTVKGITKTEKLYGIPEYEFIQIAVELDPETRKPL